MDTITSLLAGHKLLTFYLIGYIVSAVWTAVWVLREEVEESKAFRIGFAAIMGALSWLLVCIYVVVRFGGRDNGDKE